MYANSEIEKQVIELLLRKDKIFGLKEEEKKEEDVGMENYLEKYEAFTVTISNV